MSNQQNSYFLESAYEDFKQAMRGQNYDWAKKVIDEVANYGFTREAVDMCRVLLANKMHV